MTNIKNRKKIAVNRKVSIMNGRSSCLSRSFSRLSGVVGPALLPGRRSRPNYVTTMRKNNLSLTLEGRKKIGIERVQSEGEDKTRSSNPWRVFALPETHLFQLRSSLTLMFIYIYTKGVLLHHRRPVIVVVIVIIVVRFLLLLLLIFLPLLLSNKKISARSFHSTSLPSQIQLLQQFSFLFSFYTFVPLSFSLNAFSSMRWVLPSRSIPPK